MIDKKSWGDFRETGLLLIINQVLHVFGWAVVYEYDDTTNEITSVYPARVKFRGFDDKAVSENYIKITEYIHKEADNLLAEVLETEK
jgi:hypothetical protein